MLEKVLIGFLCLLGATLAVMLGVIGYKVADSVNLPERSSLGKIAGKNYHPAYTSIIVVSTGRTTTSLPQYHPPRYSVCIFVDVTQEIGCSNFDRPIWHQAVPGNAVRVTYTTGRFSGGTYIRRFS